MAYTIHNAINVIKLINPVSVPIIQQAILTNKSITFIFVILDYFMKLLSKEPVAMLPALDEKQL